jgi:hypothetical protein
MVGIWLWGILGRVNKRTWVSVCYHNNTMKHTAFFPQRVLYSHLCDVLRTQLALWKGTVYPERAMIHWNRVCCSPRCMSGRRSSPCARLLYCPETEHYQVIYSEAVDSGHSSWVGLEVHSAGSILEPLRGRNARLFYGSWLLWLLPRNQLYQV